MVLGQMSQRRPGTRIMNYFNFRDAVAGCLGSRLCSWPKKEKKNVVIEINNKEEGSRRTEPEKGTSASKCLS